MHLGVICILLCIWNTKGLNKDLTTFPGFQYQKRTHDETFRTLSPIGPQQCARECMSRKHCSTVNYDQTQFLCELSYQAGWHNSSNGYIYDGNFITFNPRPEKSYVHDCASQVACNEYYKCVINKKGTPSCLISECPDPRDVWTNVRSFDMDYGIGSHVFIGCANNDYSRYDGTNNENIKCGKDGKWIYNKDKDLNCVRRCKDPKNVWHNIAVTGDIFVAGKFVGIACKANYFRYDGFSNPIPVTCGKNGNWENSNYVNLTCFRKCDSPYSQWQNVSISGGTKDGPGHKTTIHGPGHKTMIECVNGYTREDGTEDAVAIYCGYNGAWSWQPQNRILDCSKKIIYCKNPSTLAWNIELLKVAKVTEFTEGATADIKCQSGYKRTDNTTAKGFIYCNSHGQWAPQSQACPLTNY